MSRGDKSSYTDKQKRMAEHIEESVEDRGGSEKEAERIGWATVNKQTGGGLKRKSSKKSGTGKKSSSGKKRPISEATRKKLSAAGKKGAAARHKKAA